MGKKVKKKIKNARKDSTAAHEATPVPSNESIEVVGDGDGSVKEKKGCPHIENGVDLEKVTAKIGSKGSERCEDCREGSADRKGRSKHGKKGVGGGAGKKKVSNRIWVCLQCGHLSCGGVGLPTTPQSHAMRHNRQSRHPCVVQLQNPNLCWCFPCNSLIPVGKLEQDDSVQNNALLDVVKLIKGASEGSEIDVEEVWFGGGSGDASTPGASRSLVSDGKGGYVVRGLANLGNTCFFNSVMQNLLAMDQLREYFGKLDCSVGPLTMALKKFFNETSFEADSRYGLSPRNLFGCICSRAPQFRGYQQQDSHELLRCLLDGLCTEELNMRKSACPSKENESNRKTDSTFVEAIFGGQLSSTVSCTECKHSSVVYEPFLDLSLPVPTKKSPSKKVSASRLRKAKLPKYEVRKGGKLRGKGKADSVPVLVPCPTGSSESTASSSLASSSVPVEEEKVDSFECSWLAYLSDTPPDASDSLSQNNDVSPIEVSRNKHTSQDDDMLQSSSESQPEVFGPNIEPKNSEVSKGSSSENELPLLQGSEVLLLPYKEESLTAGASVSKAGEASSSALGCDQDSMDFDGFGDLFNEPEMASGSISDNRDSKELEETKTGFLAGNSSDSDPDEVDDTSAPVSINSCLAYFTKPELLTEHAWHCENCSKTLHLQQGNSSESWSKNAVTKTVNGVQRRSQTDPLDGDFSNSTAKPRSLENGYLKGTIAPTVDRDEDLLPSSDTTKEVPHDMVDSKSMEQLSFVDQKSGSCSVNGSDRTRSNVNQVHGTVSQLKVNASESNDSDGNGKCVKVMRDATKRYLINKAPPILTIHLKRFSQDARGRLSKLSGHVVFHEKIDLSPYMSPRSEEEPNCEYHLTGVVEHSGTMRGGHYVAYVRGKRKGKTEQDNEEHAWFYASDSHVREVSLSEVFRSEAYILFYVKA